jgi:calcineurin-like phosphoesterase family protein
MTKIFITSDHHFFHNNIIKYCNRPFRDYEEMNEFMIKKWNEVVREGDIVIHLGDFAFRNKAYLILPRLNGMVVLVRGNHDLNITREDGVIIVEDRIIIGNLIFTHKPLEQIDIPEGFKNIHGHIHDKDSYFGVNVSVEKTNYTPIDIETLI